VVLIYANRDTASVIFAAKLAELATNYPARLNITHWLQDLDGFPTTADLVTAAGPFASYAAYMCGPGPFMDLVRAALHEVGLPHHRIHAEVFNSLAGDPFTDHVPAAATPEEEAGAATTEVELDGKIHTLAWPRQQTLVDIMLAKGIDVPYSCQEGECGSCMCTVTEGQVDMDNTEILAPEDIANGYILGCQAHPATSHIRITF
jgi:3-ketosteroid 9alpha-monooxygenase subunit B